MPTHCSQSLGRSPACRVSEQDSRQSWPVNGAHVPAPSTATLSKTEIVQTCFPPRSPSTGLAHQQAVCSPPALGHTGVQGGEAPPGEGSSGSSPNPPGSPGKSDFLSSETSVGVHNPSASSSGLSPIAAEFCSSRYCERSSHFQSALIHD